MLPVMVDYGVVKAHEMAPLWAQNTSRGAERLRSSET